MYFEYTIDNINKLLKNVNLKSMHNLLSFKSLKE